MFTGVRLRGFGFPATHCISLIFICQLKKMEDSQQEATEKEVERILGYLKSYYQDDRQFKVHFTDVNISPLCWFFFNVLMCVCSYNSNIPNIVLRVRHRPQLLLADSREHFPHILSDQGEPPVFQNVFQLSSFAL